MPIVNVVAPVKGLQTYASPTDIEEEASPYMSGVYLKDGILASDFGHSAYPTPGLLKTNQLNGMFMRGDEFLLSSGVTRLVAHTTTNAYEYNTTTTTWDNISKGQTVEDCEDAWTASANVTSATDTATKLRGTNSMKLVVDAAFTTGLLAYENFSSLDLSLETAAHFWIYSTIAMTAGWLQLLLDNTNNCVSPLETIDLPAITANTWTPVCIPYAAAGSLTAIVSVGLKATSDFGACSIYLDDVRSVLKYTGTVDNLFSIGILNDYMIITNGIDQPKKYGGTAATGEESLTTTLAAGSITTSEVVLIAKDHVVFMNNTENSADAPNRVSWGNIGQLQDYVGGTAGYQDLTDDSSAIVTAEQLSESRWAIYKGTSIVLMEWVGGQTPFRFTTMVKGKTIAGKACVTNVAGIHYVIGTKDIYKYAGGDTTPSVDAKNKRYIFGVIDYTYIMRSFCFWLEEDDEIQFWLPTTTAYPDRVFCVDTTLESWYVKDRTMTGAGTWVSGSALTLADLTGTIGNQNFTFGSAVIKSTTPIHIVGDNNGQVFKLDKSTLDNNGSAITNEWQSKDFVVYENASISLGGASISVSGSKKESRLHQFRVPQFYIEAKGQSVTTEYSTDGGSSWNPTQGSSTNTITLTGSYDVYQQDMDVVCYKIRFRVRNTTASSGFYVRYFGFQWLKRSDR